MTTPRRSRPVLIARGGASGLAPEHTIPACEAAVAAGADALALAVRLSADDQVVVIEDATLERTTDGRGAVRDRTVRQLKRLDAGRWFGRAFRGQRVQTLSEILERFRDRAGFVVDLPGGSDLAPGIEERVLTLLQIYGVADRTIVASFDHHALRKCRGLDPGLATVARVRARLLAPAGLAPPGVLDGVGIAADLTCQADVAGWQASGLRCYVWDVDDPLAARELLGWGVDGLVTSRPDLLRPVLDRA